MKNSNQNPSLRQGQFLWKDAEEQNNYLQLLKKKIAEGFYSSDNVISRIVDEIAPVLNDYAQDE